MASIGELIRGVSGVIATPITFIQYYGKTGTAKGFGEVNAARIRSFVSGNYGDIAENSADLATGLTRGVGDIGVSVGKNARLLPFALLIVGGVCLFLKFRK